MPETFFSQDGDRYIPSELTRGPWDTGYQHAGPPSALLGRELERLQREAGDQGPRPQLGRITYEILRAVPIEPVTVSARIVRPGRSVEMVEGTLSDADGVVMLARGWRIRPSGVELPPGLASEDPDSPARRAGRPGGQGPPPSPEDSESKPFFDTGQDVGYHTAMDYRFAAGGFLEPGPATVWMRMRQPLLEGEEPTPLQRVLCAADSGNGVSATLDWSRYLFINVDLTVELHRLPAGEWVCLDAITIPEPTGLGLSDAALFDERGPIGHATQTLLVAERRA